MAGVIAPTAGSTRRKTAPALALRFLDAAFKRWRVMTGAAAIRVTGYLRDTDHRDRERLGVAPEQFSPFAETACLHGYRIDHPGHGVAPRGAAASSVTSALNKSSPNSWSDASISRTACRPRCPTTRVPAGAIAACRGRPPAPSAQCRRLDNHGHTPCYHARSNSRLISRCRSVTLGGDESSRDATGVG